MKRVNTVQAQAEVFKVIKLEEKKSNCTRLESEKQFMHAHYLG